MYSEDTNKFLATIFPGVIVDLIMSMVRNNIIVIPYRGKQILYNIHKDTFIESESGIVYDESGDYMAYSEDSDVSFFACKNGIPFAQCLSLKRAFKWSFMHSPEHRKAMSKSLSIGLMKKPKMKTLEVDPITPHIISKDVKIPGKILGEAVGVIEMTPEREVADVKITTVFLATPMVPSVLDESKGIVYSLITGEVLFDLNALGKYFNSMGGGTVKLSISSYCNIWSGKLFTFPYDYTIECVVNNSVYICRRGRAFVYNIETCRSSNYISSPVGLCHGGVYCFNGKGLIDIDTNDSIDFDGDESPGTISSCGNTYAKIRCVLPNPMTNVKTYHTSAHTNLYLRDLDSGIVIVRNLATEYVSIAN